MNYTHAIFIMAIAVSSLVLFILYTELEINKSEYSEISNLEHISPDLEKFMRDGAITNYEFTKLIKYNANYKGGNLTPLERIKLKSSK